MNGKVRKELPFGLTIGKQSVNDSCNDNGEGLVNLVASLNMTMPSMYCQHKDIHKVT